MLAHLFLQSHLLSLLLLFLNISSNLRSNTLTLQAPVGRGSPRHPIISPVNCQGVRAGLHTTPRVVLVHGPVSIGP